MTARILLLLSSDTRCRALEDLLADMHTAVRDLTGAEAPPWSGPAPDLMVVGALGETQHAVSLVRSALALEAELSVLVVDEPELWPEAVRHLPGVSVVAPQGRSVFAAARARLLERRRLIREAHSRRTEPEDRLAAAALEGDSPVVREMRLMLDRQLDGRRRHVVVSGERGTLRSRIVRHAVRSGGGEDDTVLVEDIDELSPAQQGEVLQRAREGRRIAATATPQFKARVHDGSFRSDLYYALGGAPVVTVPLRSRPEDLDRLAHTCGLDAITEDALELLRAYAWPGNHRELEIAVEHALMLAEGGTVAAQHVMVPRAMAAESPSDAFVLRIPESGIPLEKVEEEVIRQTLEATGSNVTEAARRLHIERGKLRYRLRRYGLGR